MASDLRYFPSDGPYWPVEATIYAQYLGDVPNPCRKYHISSALEGAEIVASIVLPELVRRDIFHKVVKSRSLLSRQLAGDQAGKFITLYMSPHVTHRNPVIASLGEALLAAHRKGLVHPAEGTALASVSARVHRDAAGRRVLHLRWGRGGSDRVGRARRAVAVSPGLRPPNGGVEAAWRHR